MTDPPTAGRAAEVAERVAEVREQLRIAGGDGVSLVAVTKGFGIEEVLAARAAGVDACGESYAQEMRTKLEALGELAEVAEPPPVPWHFVGNLQRNKVRHLAGHVDLWQSVDRLSLAREVAKRRPGASILVQVNLSGEGQKGGCALDDVDEVVEGALEAGLDVRGLMGVAPQGPPERARPGFRALVARADALGLPERSIGMSGDFEVAVEEGSTMVRLGTALFGPRALGGEGRP